MLWAQALLALLVNLALLGLVAKVIMLNDVLGTVSQPTGARLLRLRQVASKRERWGLTDGFGRQVIRPLRATQMQLCEIVTTSDEEKVCTRFSTTIATTTRCLHQSSPITPLRPHNHPLSEPPG